MRYVIFTPSKAMLNFLAHTQQVANTRTLHVSTPTIDGAKLTIG
jgi:hypothetical protein